MQFVCLAEYAKRKPMLHYLKQKKNYLKVLAFYDIFFYLVLQDHNLILDAYTFHWQVDFYTGGY